MTIGPCLPALSRTLADVQQRVQQPGRLPPHDNADHRLATSGNDRHGPSRIEFASRGTAYLRMVLRHAGSCCHAASGSSPAGLRSGSACHRRQRVLAEAVPGETVPGGCPIERGAVAIHVTPGWADMVADLMPGRSRRYR